MPVDFDMGHLHRSSLYRQLSSHLAAFRDDRMNCFVRECALGAEYEFMRPAQPKTAEAAAFISNCGAQSFRLNAVRQLSQVPTIV